MPWWGWCVLALLAASVALYWLFVLTEGAYLGPRVVVFLYDRFAGRYDAIKQFDQADEAFFLGRPLAQLAAERAANPLLILDVASGSGRLAMAAEQALAGRSQIICLDRSSAMLRQAQVKLATKPVQGAAFVCHDAAPLPFVDNAFDVVACLEALEFMPDAKAVLAELLRVLRPGGMLLVSNRIGWQARLMPGKTLNRPQFEARLARLGATAVATQSWQMDYDLVLAGKAAGSSAINRSQDAMLRCPCCHEILTGAVLWDDGGDDVVCHNCGWRLGRRQGIWQAIAPAEAPSHL